MRLIATLLVLCLLAVTASVLAEDSSGKDPPSRRYS